MSDSEGIRIKDIFIKSRISLAPMAGITDWCMRKLIRKYSPNCLLTTEMLSSEALVRNEDAQIAYTDGEEYPIAFQIEGHKPELMARAAKIAEQNATIIDINMGCPINKIVKGNDGCSLMRNPELAKDIVIAVKESVKIPVTCKFRLGWSLDEKNFAEFAQEMQEAGADAVTVHGRTRSQLYSGTADWKEISKLKGNIDIPYFANGDIISPESAKECLETSKADGVAVGRAAMGELTLLNRIDKYISEGELIPEPSMKEKLKMLKEHLDLQIKFRGEEHGIKYFRKFYPYYVKNFQGGAKYRYLLVTEEKYDNIINILNEISDNEQ